MKCKLLYILPLFVLLACCTKQEERFSLHTNPVKIADYLYEIEYTGYKPDNTERYVNEMINISKGGACTVARSENFVGRNYDYLYSEMAEFIIKVPAAEGRYASIGVASSIFELTAEKAETDPHGQYFDILPYVTVDGLNEKGVYCNLNMVRSEAGDVPTTGTNPGAEPLYLSMAVRFVLDNCSSALEACQEISKRNIVFSEALGEFHFFIADRSETYVIEFQNNKMVYRHPKDDVMTNFLILKDAFIDNNDPGLHPGGLERYYYARDHKSEFTSKEAVAKIMADLRYSKAYDLSTTPFWYSEYYHHTYKGVEIDINTPKEFYADHLKDECEGYKHKTRNYLETRWFTTHTSVYDLSDLSLRVYAQEDYTKCFEYKLK